MIHDHSLMIHDQAVACVPGDPGALEKIVQNYQDIRKVRGLAMRLVGERESRHLLPLFNRTPVQRGPWAELLACLIQELLLHGIRLDRRPAVMACLSSLQRINHPLAFLPPKLTAAERRAAAFGKLHPFSPHDTPCGALGPWIPDPPTEACTMQSSGYTACRDVTTSEQVEEIASTVKHWSCSPKVLILRGEKSLKTEDIIPVGVNRYLPEGYRVKKGGPASLSDIFAILLHAAYQRGSYEQGIWGAYGRPAVWATIGGLTGASPGTPIIRVNELAARWRWFHFEQDFEDYWVDHALAIGALSPRGSHLGLLFSNDAD